uniref:Uncharacterized protein n=1 Tax=Rhizophora mucronata TaxID=61149 RepID=A0A2P2QU78_RHIMU
MFKYYAIVTKPFCILDQIKVSYSHTMIFLYLSDRISSLCPNL